ncbi:MAG: CRISPR-associated protein Cas4 [Muribaculaceae bacterium]|nr:CRISPR-associated protein Cas4 [Muribaculaceae bacterium]
MKSSDSRRFSDDEMLQLSGIQHFVFCPRQWALIHLEQVWDDNNLTMEGQLLHQNVDNPFFRESGHSDVISLRGFRLASYSLGLSGIADVIEIYPHDNAPHGKKAILESKLFDVLPVEYKRGKPKLSDCDRLQVVAQAYILEEMFGIKIEKGAVFYWEVRHREYFDIDDEMKQKVKEIALLMHDMESQGKLPPAVKCKYCKNCSLIDFCLPSLTGKSAVGYIKDSLLY